MTPNRTAADEGSQSACFWTCLRGCSKVLSEKSYCVCMNGITSTGHAAKKCHTGVIGDIIAASRQGRQSGVIDDLLNPHDSDEHYHPSRHSNHSRSTL